MSNPSRRLMIAGITIGSIVILTFAANWRGGWDFSPLAGTEKAAAAGLGGTPTPTPDIQFSSSNFDEDEGNTAMITLNRTGNTSGTDTVNVSTMDETAHGCAAPGPGCDFQSINNMPVTFMPGQTQAQFPVFVLPAPSERSGNPPSFGPGLLYALPPGERPLAQITYTHVRIHDAAGEYRNQQAMTITAGGTSDVYPSNITVAGETGPIYNIRVTLFHLSHSFPGHLDVLLVGPGGQKYILMADSGGSNAISSTSPVSLTFEDNAGKVLPDTSALTWDVSEPTSRRTPITSLPAPAPAAPYSEPGSAVGGSGTQTLNGRFAGTDPNGVWSLYVRDNSPASLAPDVASSGMISGGWGLEFNESFQRRPGDFGGDGRSDISVWRPSDGNWYWLNSSDSTFNVFQFGASGDQIVPGDYDGDGKGDFAVFRSGTWYIWGSTAGFSARQFGLASDLPTQGDFDEDGETDIAVFRPSNGTWYFFGSNTGFSAVQFGANGDKPVAGDYDGDGKTDIAVYRPTEGEWYLLRSTAGYTAAQFGIASDKVVPGDYNGDGKTDLAVFRPGNNTWYIARPTGVPSQNFDAFQFGTAGDVPVPGDYDGDHKTDIGVYRPSSGSWFLQKTISGFAAQQFGAINDKPTAASYVPNQ